MKVLAVVVLAVFLAVGCAHIEPASQVPAIPDVMCKIREQAISGCLQSPDIQANCKENDIEKRCVMYSNVKRVIVITQAQTGTLVLLLYDIKSGKYSAELYVNGQIVGILDLTSQEGTEAADRMLKLYEDMVDGGMGI